MNELAWLARPGHAHLSRWLSLPWPPGFGWCCCTPGANGYTCGGSLGGTFYTRCDKTSFSSETTASTTTADLTVARNGLAAVGNPDLHGYYCGGSSGPHLALTDKLTFASDTTAAATTANLSVVKSTPAGVSERSTKAYIAGGFTGATFATRSLVTDKLTFSGDTTAAATTANLSLARAQLVGVTEGASKGYFAGGITAAGTAQATADLITYSTDSTAAQTTANLSTVRHSLHGFSDGSTFGWFAGGNTGSGGASSIVDRVTFSTDTTAVRTSAAFGHQQGHGMSDGTKGLATTADAVATVYKFVFATEVDSALGVSGDLSQARVLGAACCTTAL